MNYRELIREIHGKHIRPLYLFYGEERYLQEEAVRQILQQLVEPSRRDFNYHSFSGKETAAATLLDIASSPPFSAPKRLILIREAEQLSPAQQEKLLLYCRQPCSTTCLIFMAIKKSFISQFLQEIPRSGAIVEFPPLPAGEVLNWILKKAKAEGFRISPPAARYLLEGVGNNLFGVYNELLKVISYVGKKGSIDLADVQQVSPPSNQASVFSLAEALAEKKLAAALSSLHLLVNRNEPPLVILTMIIRHFRHLRQAKCLKENGYAVGAISRQLGLPPFRVEKLILQAEKLSERELGQAWSCFLETDRSLKSSALQGKLVLESLVLKICLGEI